MNAVENEKALRKVMFYCIFQLYRAIKRFGIPQTALLYNVYTMLFTCNREFDR